MSDIKDNITIQPSITKAVVCTQRPKKRSRGIKQSLRIVKKAIALGRQYHAYLYVALTMVFVSTFFELMIPVYIGKAVDQLVGKGSVNFDMLAHHIVMMLIFVVAAAISTYIYNICTNKYCYKSSGHIRKLMFEKFNTAPLKFIDQSSHGDLMSRMVNDVEMLTDGFLEGLTGITNGVVTILGTLIFMFVLNLPLAIVVTVLTPISLVIGLYIAKKSYKLFISQLKEEGEITGYLEEMISNEKIVKVSNYENTAEQKYGVINDRYYNSCQKAEFYSNLANPVTRFINATVYGIVGLAGSLLVINYGLTIGMIATFLSYANSFGKPFNELSSEITQLQAAFAAAERIFAVIDAETEKSDADLPELASVDGWVSVRNVCFGYLPKQRLIDGFTLDVAPGQKVAIVGPTGCGKTTFINLLMRFYDIDEGEILLDGHNISQIKRSSLRNKYGMVLQESWLYNASIRDNIAYGKPSASLEEVVEASKLAGCDDFISKLDNGYDTMVSEDGSNVSQGQRQLICIARIMLVKPAMLILDEATSNIDTRTELNIQKAFSSIMQGRTTFIVAHRLSTIESADIILVMNKGNIIEQGSHQELLERHGFYYNLYNSQFIGGENI